MDFTVKQYLALIATIIHSRKTVYTFEEFLETNREIGIIIRHDVDRTPLNALKMADFENQMGIRATYFFRSHSHVFKKEIIGKIQSLGHEIGYHYENLSDSKGDYNKAIRSFSETLEKFREIATIKTICMHGSPLSKYDNRFLWEKYNFQDFGIAGEPYFSVDFNKTAYITDAGRKWNDEKVNFRDRVNSTIHLDIKSTDDIIKLIKSSEAPSSLMINMHPHNWAFSSVEWGKIYFWQGFKNAVKTTFHALDKRD